MLRNLKTYFKERLCTFILQKINVDNVNNRNKMRNKKDKNFKREQNETKIIFYLILIL